MSEKKPETLKDVMEVEDLSGYRLTTVYYLELDHGLMGTFPAIRSDNGEIVSVLDPNVLKFIQGMLPTRKWKISKVFCIVHMETGRAFNLRNQYIPDEEVEPLQVLTEEELCKLVKEQEEPFRWAPGLLSRDTTREEFTEMLEVAREQGPP